MHVCVRQLQNGSAYYVDIIHSMPRHSNCNMKEMQRIVESAVIGSNVIVNSPFVREGTTRVRE